MVVVIVLVSVVSLRFKCQKNKESEGTCPDSQGTLCLSLMRDPQPDSRPDTQLRIEGRNSTQGKWEMGGGPLRWALKGRLGF